VAEAQRSEGEPDAVSYEMLQDLLRSERRSNKLVPVGPRFWLQVRDFLGLVTDAFRVEQAKDPFGRRVMMLTDEVKNARHAAESLWALRERKLAMLALAATKERKRPEGITPDEAELYARFLETLDVARQATFGGLLPQPAGVPAGPGTQMAGQSASAPPAPVPLQMPLAERPMAAAPILAVPAAPAAPVQVVQHDTQAAANVELVTIRALGDIPPFVGPDMQTYLLKQGDVATVPPSIASLLVRRNKATILQG
jgi:DNA replication initiation complex subunit (GINS family)